MNRVIKKTKPDKLNQIDLAATKFAEILIQQALAKKQSIQMENKYGTSNK